MGNCCGSLSNPKLQQRDYISPKESQPLQQPIIGPEDDNDDDDDNDDSHHDHLETTSAATTRSNTPFQGTPQFNELSTTTTTRMLPFVDPRLVSVLDFSRQLYMRRKDIFNKVMPVHRQDLEAIFSEMKKVQQVEKNKSEMVGFVRQRSMSYGDEKGVNKMERFKVKPIDSKGAPKPSDGKGGGGSKPAGSK